MKKTIVATLLIISVMVACSKSTPANNGGGSIPINTPPVTPPTPAINCSDIDSKFSTAVSTIIQNSCAIGGCHNDGSNNGPGALTSFDKIKSVATAVKNAVESGRMPRGSSLTPTQKQAIICWADAGAPNN